MSLKVLCYNVVLLVVILLLSIFVNINEATKTATKATKTTKNDDSSYATFNETQSFFEELIIKPLPRGKLMTHVQFTTEWNSNFLEKSTFQHYDLFPRSIGDLITRVGIEEFTLVFTQGRWSYSEWGYPVRAAPVGVELIAWMKPLEKGIDAQWRELTHSLSGLFCASMQFLYQVPHHTSSPNRSFRPEGESNIYNFNEENDENNSSSSSSSTTTTPAIKLNNGTIVPLELRYGILPRESVCTENLTPWVKLLPCREQSGLGKLLNPHKLYDVHYHSMSITIRKICNNNNKDDSDSSCLSPTLEIVQSLTIVNDLNNNQQQESIETNLDNLFGLKGNTGLSACPLASRSKIYIQKQPSLNTNLKITGSSGVYGVDGSDDGGGGGDSDHNHNHNSGKKETDNFYIYDLMKYSTNKPLKLKMSWLKNFKRKNETPVVAHSHLTGYGQERGGIATQIFNTENYAINITYFQAIPWYLRLYFHTLKFNIETSSDEKSIDNHRKDDGSGSPFLSYKNISPAETRSSPSTIELSFEIPPNSVAFMSIEFDKVFLHYTEHPPDANRGFDLGSGVVTAFIQSSNDNNGDAIHLEWSNETYNNHRNHHSEKDKSSKIIPVRIYTEGLLITLPTPDFSMLYNVITLTGTVFALFFGSMINILIRRFKNTFTGNDFVSDRPIAKIYRRILRFIDGK
ncbi:hypothetical protein RB653_005099 [Dictyostelium firmibasis]|uniref:Uncharacterized protein n=1 Tax=Dictyostelium firmibasis TaxID=79012 RepID=A0AAN7UKH0_9MYCE